MNKDQKPKVPLDEDVPVELVPHLKEVMDLNRLWKQEYDSLLKQFEHEKGLLKEDNHKLKQEVRKSELRCAKLETKNVTLQSELVHLARTFEVLHPQRKSISSETDKDLEDVELIKEQLNVYKEDFKLEHQDKEKIRSEKRSLQEKLLLCEKHVHTLNKELELYKKECKRLHEERGRYKQTSKHPIVDRSNSYPSTADAPYGPFSKETVHRATFEKNEKPYLSLEDFRHEQYKRGILVRNPTLPKPRPPAVHLHVTPAPPRRKSDSTADPTDISYPSSSRTSCLW